VSKLSLTSAYTRPSDVAAALLGRRRFAILSLLIEQPDGLHLREIARRSRLAAPTVQRELARLVGAGIMTTCEVSGRRLFRVDRASLLYPELRSIVRKTSGVFATLTEALAPLAGKLITAFVYGSFARGDESRESDVDLFVVGDISFAEVVAATRSVQSLLGREVNPTIYPPAELRAKMRRRHHFVSRVMEDEKVFLVGGPDELAAVVGERVAPAAPVEPTGNG
jgi:predicted nucleotidyltransferase